MRGKKHGEERERGRHASVREEKQLGSRCDVVVSRKYIHRDVRKRSARRGEEEEGRKERETRRSGPPMDRSNIAPARAAPRLVTW